ncbi:hypothetical protein BJ741DRAFT_584492 [Chytriomyces cf. hyalinus JEL632]|nr:hypothetical protein BJ741DRAFT_584492 [Chytriomyces cf. hyalinus JEL632]
MARCCLLDSHQISHLKDAIRSKIKRIGSGELTLVRVLKDGEGGLTASDLWQPQDPLKLASCGSDPESSQDVSSMLKTAPGASLAAAVFPTFLKFKKIRKHFNVMNWVRANRRLFRIHSARGIGPRACNSFGLFFLKRSTLKQKYVCAWEGATVAQVLNVVGVDIVLQRQKMKSLPLVVMIDDAQNTYHDRNGWDAFMNEAVLRIPASIKFIISATSSLHGGIGGSHFALSDEDVLADLDLSAGLRSDGKFDSLKQVIVAHGGGFFGALRLSVDLLNAKPDMNHGRPTEGELLRYYFSSEFLLFGTDHSMPQDETFKKLVGRRPLASRLQEFGVLVEDNKQMRFSPILAQRYFLEVSGDGEAIFFDRHANWVSVVFMIVCLRLEERVVEFELQVPGWWVQCKERERDTAQEPRRWHKQHA